MVGTLESERNKKINNKEKCLNKIGFRIQTTLFIPKLAWFWRFQKSPNLVRMRYKTYVLHHLIRVAKSTFYLKFNTSYST